MRVFINGFGRIGRTILRQLLSDPAHKGVELVGVNDTMSLENAAYLFQYDSAFGTFEGNVDFVGDHLTVKGQTIRFHHEIDLRKVDLKGVDIVLECTGGAKTVEIARRGLDVGANAIVIAGPSNATETTVVLGANTSDLGSADIVSVSSCTTNAIAPLLAAIDLGLGIRTAYVTTIHCYTGSQPTIDAPNAQMERGRSAAVSLVPTTTSAATEIEGVLPSLKNRISIASVRVPTHSVSAIDVTVQLEATLVEPVQYFLKEAFEGSPIVAINEAACVSVDMRGRPESLILALNETRCVGNDQIRLFGWYDNEWGYAARMIDMAQRMHNREQILGD